MRAFSVSLLLLVASANAFSTQTLSPARSASVALDGYVPDGFTAASYKAFKDKEAKSKKQGLGRMGPKGFQSRSMQSFQEAMERGEATHLMPVFNANERIKKGELRKEDVPYMQRGGSWDNTDIKGAKNKKQWLKSDKQYASGGYRKEQSTSIFGYGGGLDWTGKQSRTGPSETIPGAAPKFGKNYKAPNVKNMKGLPKDMKGAAAKPKKGLFGMF